MASKKKSAKKKSAKKKGKKKRKSITIVLRQGVDPVAKHPTLSRSGHDRVRFWNRSDRGRSIQFALWPFVEPPQAILVKANRRSAWFTIYENVPANSAYSYSSVPSLGWPAGGPGSPDVIAGG